MFHTEYGSERIIECSWERSSGVNWIVLRNASCPEDAALSSFLEPRLNTLVPSGILSALGNQLKSEARRPTRKSW